MSAQELSTTTCFPEKADRKLPLVSDEPEIVRVSLPLKKLTKKMAGDRRPEDIPGSRPEEEGFYRPKATKG